MELRYDVHVFWSDEDGCWIADAPDLKYCSAHGEIPAEAIANIQDAMEVWLETTRERGIPIPEPHDRPTIYTAG